MTNQLEHNVNDLTSGIESEQTCERQPQLLDHRDFGSNGEDCIVLLAFAL